MECSSPPWTSIVQLNGLMVLVLGKNKTNLSRNEKKDRTTRRGLVEPSAPSILRPRVSNPKHNINAIFNLIVM